MRRKEAQVRQLYCLASRPFEDTQFLFKFIFVLSRRTLFSDVDGLKDDEVIVLVNDARACVQRFNPLLLLVGIGHVDCLGSILSRLLLLIF